MKKSTKVILSILTGLLPFWLVSYHIVGFIDSQTGTVKVIGNRRMLLHLHPAVQIMLAGVLTGLLLFMWYKATANLWPGLHELVRRVQSVKLNIKKMDKSFIGSFLEFGQWKAEWIVKFIFYLGILAVILQGINLTSMFMYSPKLVVVTGSPFSQAITGLIILLALIIALVVWKCVCEILLIVLRALEVYFIKSVYPEKLKSFYEKPDHLSTSQSPTLEKTL